MAIQSPSNLLRSRFAHAIAQVSGNAVDASDAYVRPAGDSKFGDYQCNAAMVLAKAMKAKPREVAEKIVAAVTPALADVIEPLEIAGPGFINIRLKPEFLAAFLEEIGASEPESERVGVRPTPQPRRVVIDYSAPNIAKQMHVGHLRSTIIGDALARVLSFEGHEVIRQNHIGDWGTQFGMLIEYYASNPLPGGADHAAVLSQMEDDYRAANERFKTDAAFANAARLAVGRLQSGDPAAREVWRRVCEASSAAFTDIYERLGVLLQPGDVCGESFYNSRLASVVAELREKLPPRAAGDGPWVELRDDQGAVCLFFYKADGQPLFKNPEGEPLPMIIQKSDGAYLYATTDLAAVRYRLLELGATRVLYVVGAPTKLHLEMLHTTARFVGWAEPDVQLEHVSFGQVLGDDRKLLRTRSGGAVKLKELLDEAERRAADLLEAKLAAEDADYRASFTAEEKSAIARRIGIGAVKYFDLARERNSDYVFNWDQMLALQGNTAPYLLYAYTRIRSIYRKAAQRFGSPDVYAAGVRLGLQSPAERTLALRLARFHEAVEAVAAELTPHMLCNYLYELAGEFMRFYEACPVLASDETTRLARMRLCDLTARTLRVGLGLLGIEVVERM